MESHNQCLPMGATNFCNLSLTFYKWSQDNRPCYVAVEKYLHSLLSPLDT